MSRALVAGWFSFEDMGATAGDLFARDLCTRWLSELGWAPDVAHAPPFEGGVDWRTVDPKAYELVVFVCGPFGNGWPITEFLEHFSGVKLVGLNLSMLEDVENWNPFDVLIERDSSRTARPDISFLSEAPAVPVIGVVLVHPQNEYDGAMHEHANAAVERLLASRDVAQVAIDTRLDVNETRLDSPRQVESLIARMDAVVTTRLHGTVLAIKNGIPPLVIDPIAGGRKVIQQTRTIGWSAALTADEITEDRLSEALDFCLSAEGRAAAARVRSQALSTAAEAHAQFVVAVGRAEEGEH